MALPIASRASVVSVSVALARLRGPPPSVARLIADPRPHPPRAVAQPVCRSIVEDGVHELADRDRDLDCVEKADELLMAVALHAPAEYRAEGC
jgi:hypothetical protein